MSITDYRADFLKAVDGTYVLLDVTMEYREGGARENFAFVVSRPEGGEPKVLNIDVPTMTTRGEVIALAKAAAFKEFGHPSVAAQTPAASNAQLEGDDLPNPFITNG